MNVHFPDGSDGKESACNAGDPGSIPGSGRSPGEGNGNPLQYSCLENPIDRRAWRATVHGSQRIIHNWVTNTFTSLFPWLGEDDWWSCQQLKLDRLVHKTNWLSQSSLCLFWVPYITDPGSLFSVLALCFISCLCLLCSFMTFKVHLGC